MIELEPFKDNPCDIEKAKRFIAMRIAGELGNLTNLDIAACLMIPIETINQLEKSEFN